MADVIEDIKARLDIVDVVSQYVQLKKMGRNYKALCPFHSEKTPSFVVSTEKQICHCFGCNKGGDIFGFIKEVEGVEFPEAIQILADRAGIKLENFSKYSNKTKSEKDDYFKAHDLACDIFQTELKETEEGKKVLEYLYKRGVKDETIEQFKIGYAPDKFDFLHQKLLAKGISGKILLQCGFASSKNIGSNEMYDKFRGRLMFPIFDYLGRICGFGGRICDFIKKKTTDEQGPKYLNSPENPIYSKSKVLYGLYHSKQAVKEKDKIILVEGYFDVIMPFQEGVRNIAAVSGTALTEYQATLIKRLTQNVVTCFDMDDAGFEATKRAYSVLRNQDIMMKTVSGFGQKDPADFVKEKSGEDFNKFVEEAADFVGYYIDRLFKDNDVATIEGRRKVFNELLPLYKQMQSVTKDFYVRILAEKLNIKESFIYDEIDKLKLPASHPARQASDKSQDKVVGILPEQVIFSIVLQCPKLWPKLKKSTSEKDFDKEFKEIYNALLAEYNEARIDKGEWNFDKGFLRDNKQKVDVLLLYAQERYDQFSEENLEAELQKLIDKIRKTRKSKDLDALHKQIYEAEKIKDKDKLKELLQQQQKLLSE